MSAQSGQDGGGRLPASTSPRRDIADTRIGNADVSAERGDLIVPASELGVPSEVIEPTLGVELGTDTRGTRCRVGGSLSADEGSQISVSGIVGVVDEAASTEKTATRGQFRQNPHDVLVPLLRQESERAFVDPIGRFVLTEPSLAQGRNPVTAQIGGYDMALAIRHGPGPLQNRLFEGKHLGEVDFEQGDMGLQSHPERAGVQSRAQQHDLLDTCLHRFTEAVIDQPNRDGAAIKEPVR